MNEAQESHLPFWKDMAGKLGPPIFAGTLVGCLLQGKSEATHYVLLAVGFALMVVSHRQVFHR